MYTLFHDIRNWILFSSRALIVLPNAFRYRYETVKQAYIIGNQSLFLVVFASMLINMVLAMEMGKRLEPFGAKLMLGSIVGISTIREIGPLITGLMVAGRTGAKIVSEIGNMALTEQTDALRAFGVDPIKRLIVPRLFATIVVMIPLAILADALGIIAGWFASTVWMNVDSQMFWQSLRERLFIKDLTIGFLKPPFFGLVIGMISSYYGYTVKGGAEGLGRAATKAVMYATLGVLVVDFLITKIVISFY
jgi:phospholipid/cholesterol/gamma-HCH transport system permease protein